MIQSPNCVWIDFDRSYFETHWPSPPRPRVESTSLSLKSVRPLCRLLKKFNSSAFFTHVYFTVGETEMVNLENNTTPSTIILTLSKHSSSKWLYFLPPLRNSRTRWQTKSPDLLSRCYAAPVRTTPRTNHCCMSICVCSVRTKWARVHCLLAVHRFVDPQPIYALAWW